MFNFLKKEKLKWSVSEEAVLKYKWMHIVSLALILLHRFPRNLVLGQFTMPSDEQTLSYAAEAAKVALGLIHLYFTANYYQSWYKLAVILSFYVFVNLLLSLAVAGYSHMLLLWTMVYLIAAWFIQITQNKIFKK